MAPEMALVAAPKNALPMVVQVVPERGWYGLEMALVAAHKNALPIVVQVVPERGWYGD